MDKAEYQVKLDEISKLLDNEDYEGAAKVADSIDWKRVKSVRTLNMIGGIYEVNKRFADAKKIFLLAYKRAPISKSVLCSLVEINLKLGEYEEAVKYYTVFAKNAKNDNMKYILKYKIYKAKRSPIEEQIAILEDYKEREYTEKWAYELAKLYQQAGMDKECVDLCDDLVLWFSDGTYVMKAMELKMRFSPLSPSQRITYENRHKEEVTVNKNPFSGTSSIGALVKESQYENNFKPTVNPILSPQLQEVAITREEDVKVKPIIIEDMSKLQDKFAQGIRSVFSGGKQEDDEIEFNEEELELLMEHQVSVEPEDESDFTVVKALEPEQITRTPIQAENYTKSALHSFVATPLNDSKKSIQDIDLEALMAETASSLAQEVATGDYEQTALLEEEKKIAKEKAEAKAKEAAKEVALAKETDNEDLGLTREFNFDQELKEFKAKMLHTKQTEETNKAKNQFEKIEEFVLPPEILAEIEAKKEKVVESIPLMTAPIIDEFKIVPSSEKGKAPRKDKPVPLEVKETEIEVIEEDTPDTVVKEVEGGITEDLEKALVAISNEDADIVIEDNPSELEEEEEKASPLESDEVEEAESTQESEELQSVNEELDESEVNIQEVEESDEGVESVQEETTQEDFKTVEDVEEGYEEESIEVCEDEDEHIEVPEIDMSIVEEMLLDTPKEDLGLTKEIDADTISKERFNEKINDNIIDFSEPIEPRRFNQVEKKLFTYFSSIPGMDVQLTTAIEAIRRGACEKTSKSGNVVIMGRKGSGKTRLAEALVQAACKGLEMEAAKVAYLDAANLNDKDPVKVVAKLSGGFLLIQNASQLSEITINKLSKSMEFRTDSLKVILEDEKDAMKELLKNRPDFAKKFDTIVTIPVFTNDELVTFAKTYASESGFRMDDMGVLALYTLIGDNQVETEPITIGRVKDMMDDAIKRATRGTRKLGRKFSKKQTTDDDRIILYEKDFDY